MKRGKVTALVMAFIMAVAVLASPVTMLNTNAAVKAKKITMAKKATLEVGAKKKLKVTVKPAMVCIPSSRQLKKYKIFVLPGWISGNIFMPPIVAFHEIPLVLRLQVLSVAGRLYSNLYIL